MDDSRWLKLTYKLWPEIRDYNEASQIHAVMAIIALMWTLPFALAAFIWLFTISDWALLINRSTAFIVLFLAIFALMATSFSIQFEAGENNSVTISGSLTTMVIWGAILVMGPSILWSYGLVTLLMALITARNLLLFNENPFWVSASQLSQNWGAGLLPLLCATAVYKILGGTYPLTELTTTNWPAIAASMLLLIFLPAVILLPTFTEISRINGKEKLRMRVLQIALGSVLLGMISVPFSILLALSFSLAGLYVFLFFLLGIVLVNWLLHRLTGANIQQQRHYRELAALEELSEVLLKSAPDASALEALLVEHLPKLFKESRIQIRLFAQQMEPDWPLFQISYPANQPNATEENWEKLKQTKEPILKIHDVIMPGEKGVFGDAVMVKIMASSDEKGSESANSCLGGIYFIRHRFHGKTVDSIPTLQGLASQISGALFRAKAYKEVLMNQKMTQELEFAGQIQASFLPKQVPQITGWDMTAAIIPARQTSGDFYDFVDLGNGRIGLIVADVSDKGTGAALYMALTRTLIRTYAAYYPDAPEMALQAANDRIFADTETEQFVTVFYGILDVASGHLTYANAGHNPAFIVGSQQAELQKTGIPLGMYEGITWKQNQIQLAAGDTLAAYTDGVPEAENHEKAEFGEERLWQILQKGHGRTASETATAVLEAIDTFVGNAPQFDDITLMVVNRQS